MFKLGEDLQILRTAFAGNINVATTRMATARNLNEAAGILTVADFEKFSRQHMVAFFPLIRIRQHVREGTLGEKYWQSRGRLREKMKYLHSYMAMHEGRQPRLPMMDWVWTNIVKQPTTLAQIYVLALKLYGKR